MTERVLSVAGILVLSLTACGPAPKPGAQGQQSGSLALSRDDALLYAVDTDSNRLFIIDTTSHELAHSVEVGKSPTQIVVAPDDTLFISNRQSRSVSVIRRGAWDAVQTIDVGVEPVGMTLSPDGKTLYVVNSTSTSKAETGTLMAIHTSSLQPNWEVEVGDEPRDVVLVQGDKALVSLNRQGDVATVDLKEGRLLSSGTDLYKRANTPSAAANETTAAAPSSTFHPRGMGEMVAFSDGRRVLAPMTWSREDPIVRPPVRNIGYYSSGGPCGGSVTTPGLVPFDANAQPQLGTLTNCDSVIQQAPVQGPSAIALDTNERYVFLVQRESKNVLVMPTGDTSVRNTVPVGAGADGIALTRDGKKAYVYNQFDHRVDVLESDANSNDGRIVNTGRSITLTQDVLPADVVAGRKLFFDASDASMSAVGTHVACSSCHLDGREDGHVWNFPDGPRQTPSLAGRAIVETAPFHWTGEFRQFDDFLSHTVEARMGGKGLTPEQAQQMKAFLAWLPPADNPHRRADGVLSDSQQRGKAVFSQAQCDSCHAGAHFTNDLHADVGTWVTTGRNPDEAPPNGKRGFNTPSLLSLARTAPYLHDGSAPTLKARLLQDQASDRHGATSQLSAQEMDDLVEYLKSL